MYQNNPPVDSRILGDTRGVQDTPGSSRMSLHTQSMQANRLTAELSKSLLKSFLKGSATQRGEPSRSRSRRRPGSTLKTQRSQSPMIFASRPRSEIAVLHDPKHLLQSVKKELNKFRNLKPVQQQQRKDQQANKKRKYLTGTGKKMQQQINEGRPSTSQFFLRDESQSQVLFQQATATGAPIQEQEDGAVFDYLITNPDDRVDEEQVGSQPGNAELVTRAIGEGIVDRINNRIIDVGEDNLNQAEGGVHGDHLQSHRSSSGLISKIQSFQNRQLTEQTLRASNRINSALGNQLLLRVSTGQLRHPQHSPEELTTDPNNDLAAGVQIYQSLEELHPGESPLNETGKAFMNQHALNRADLQQHRSSQATEPISRDKLNIQEQQAEELVSINRQPSIDTQLEYEKYLAQGGKLYVGRDSRVSRETDTPAMLASSTEYRGSRVSATGPFIRQGTITSRAFGDDLEVAGKSSEEDLLEAKKREYQHVQEELKQISAKAIEEFVREQIPSEVASREQEEKLKLERVREVEEGQEETRDLVSSSLITAGGLGSGSVSSPFPLWMKNPSVSTAKFMSDEDRKREDMDTKIKLLREQIELTVNKIELELQNPTQNITVRQGDMSELSPDKIEGSHSYLKEISSPSGSPGLKRNSKERDQYEKLQKDEKPEAMFEQRRYTLQRSDRILRRSQNTRLPMYSKKRQELEIAKFSKKKEDQQRQKQQQEEEAAIQEEQYVLDHNMHLKQKRRLDLDQFMDNYKLQVSRYNYKKKEHGDKVLKDQAKHEFNNFIPKINTNSDKMAEAFRKRKADREASKEVRAKEIREKIESSGILNHSKSIEELEEDRLKQKAKEDRKKYSSPPSQQTKKVSTSKKPLRSSKKNLEKFILQAVSDSINLELNQRFMQVQSYSTQQGPTVQRSASPLPPAKHEVTKQLATLQKQYGFKDKSPKRREKIRSVSPMGVPSSGRTSKVASQRPSYLQQQAKQKFLTSGRVRPEDLAAQEIIKQEIQKQMLKGLNDGPKPVNLEEAIKKINSNFQKSDKDLTLTIQKTQNKMKQNLQKYMTGTSSQQKKPPQGQQPQLVQQQVLLPVVSQQAFDHSPVHTNQQMKPLPHQLVPSTQQQLPSPNYHVQQLGEQPTSIFEQIQNPQARHLASTQVRASSNMDLSPPPFMKKQPRTSHLTTKEQMNKSDEDIPHLDRTQTVRSNIHSSIQREDSPMKQRAQPGGIPAFGGGGPAQLQGDKDGYY